MAGHDMETDQSENEEINFKSDIKCVKRVPCEELLFRGMIYKASSFAQKQKSSRNQKLFRKKQTEINALPTVIGGSDLVPYKKQGAIDQSFFKDNIDDNVSEPKRKKAKK